MNVLDCSPTSSIESRRCASFDVPSVTATSACVWPRVKSAEPCARGSSAVSIEIGRTSFMPRPSTRSPLLSTWPRRRGTRRHRRDAAMSCGVVGILASRAARRSPSSPLSTDSMRACLSLLIDRLGDLAFGQLLDVGRELGARSPPSSTSSSRLRLLPSSSSWIRDQLLDRAVAERDAVDDVVLGHLERAALDHHDRVLRARRR